MDLSTAQPPVTIPQPNNPLDVDQTDEQVICEIRRHPIGIIGRFVVVGLLLIILAVVVFFAVPHLFSDTSSGRKTSIAALVFFVGIVIAAAFLWVINKVYQGNRWIVTSGNITQITQTSLFDRQVSQLSLADLEDITAEQDGPIAEMFNYGVLSAETAAATDKFTFLYCPNPNDYAKQILAARERFEQSRRPAVAEPVPPAEPAPRP